MTDQQVLSVTEILEALHTKLGENLSASSHRKTTGAYNDSLSRAILNVGTTLSANPNLSEHQKHAVTQFEEIFCDVTLALYFAFCGLHNSCRMALRRALELAMAILVYWDDPIQFWGWMECDKDVKFSDLLASISSAEYAVFIERECGLPKKSLQLESVGKLYRELSNVVHPKPRNFATTAATRFTFSEQGLVDNLEIIGVVQGAILEMMFRRFPMAGQKIAQSFKDTEQFIV